MLLRSYGAIKGHRKGTVSKPVFLGIDTSCYTTSLAVTDRDGNLLFDRRIILPVSAGEKGLQQSTALFYHVRNLPRLVEEAFGEIPGTRIQAVAASSRPRPREDSYMPVFTAGVSLADSMAAILKIPVGITSHQEGHLVAGLWSVNRPDLENFLVLHLSGGTTELLRVRKAGERPLRYEVEIMGGSTDIQAGQLVDRVGVAMGLPFPCGSALEKMAAEEDNIKREEENPSLTIPSSVKGCWMSFSGAETLALSYLQQDKEPSLVARAVEHCIATAVEKAARRAVEATGWKDIVLVGGVAANGYIRRRLQHRLEHRAVGARLYFPQPRYCSDNAVGTSLVARSMISGD